MPKLLLRCLLFLAPLLTSAQNFSFLRYSVSDGLPQSQVYAVFQDSKGYMWLGTQGGGLSRFDGKQFDNFSTEDGLPVNYVNTLCEDDGRRLWAGTTRGLAWFDGKKFNTLPGFSGTVLALCADSPGRLRIGTDQGLLDLDLQTNKITPVNLPTGASPVLALLPSKNGLWVGTTAGAVLLGQQIRTVGAKQGLPYAQVYAFARDLRGNLWMGTPGGIGIWNEERGLMTGNYRNALLEGVQCLAADAQGNMWAGTVNNGLSLWSQADSSWSTVTEQQGLPHNNVKALALDRSGSIWAATSGGGVARFVTRNFRHYDRSDGLAGDRVYAVMEDSRHRIWCAVSQNGLQVIDSTGLHHFDRDSGFLNVKCKTIAEDRQGRLWVGTEGKGLVVFDTGGMRVLNRDVGLPGNFIQKIVRDPASGDMWVATYSDGLARVSAGTGGAFSVRTFGVKDGLPDAAVSTLLPAPDGSLWFGCLSGKIGRIKNQKVDWLAGPERGLPATPVRCLAIDGHNQLWAGTKGEGIFYSNLNEKSRFLPLKTPKRLTSGNIYTLQFDQTGHLWAGSENGVDKITFDGQGQTAVNVEHFSKNEGFLGIELCQDAVLCDHSGNLWFGTMNGLTEYIPGNRTTSNAAPTVHFVAISLFYKPIPQTNYSAFAGPDGGLLPGLELPHNQNHLSFEFKAVDLQHPDGVRYRWKLEGAETEWSPWADQPHVNYANLPPGKYTFWVQATSDEVTLSDPIAASFTILKPFWQHWPFQAALVLVLMGFIGLVARVWVQRVRKAEQARREQLEVANRMLQLEQKALQLQMNPHFIFNALNSIQSLIATRDYGVARTQINEFAKLMRATLSNSRRQVITLREEVDTLEQYLRIEQFCQQNSFEFDITVADSLDADGVEIPPMLLQPFVENAVIHGVSHLNYPGHITLRFDLEDQDLLCVTLTDNGVGREKAALLRQARKPGHQSTALQVTRERLDAMRGERPYEALNISDITNAAGDIAGTRVVVRLPVNLIY